MKIRTSPFFSDYKLSVFLGCIILSPMVQAQGQDVESEEDKFRLEEVIVTANRREETLQDVALSISAMSGAQLDEIGASSFSDYFRNIPSVNITDRGPGRNNITIRGVTVDAEQGQIPTTAVYIDDSPITAQFSNTDLRVYDVERVEVLRGPQGTLYGASSLGGAIRFITNKANPNKFEAYVNASYETTSGGDNGYLGDAAINIPILEDTLAVRISAYSERDPGYIDNFGAFDVYAMDPSGATPVVKDIGGADTEGGRISLRWNVTESITATFGYVYQKSEGAGQPDVETVLGTTIFDPENFEPIDFMPSDPAAQTSINDLAAFAVGDESLNDEIWLPSFNLQYASESLGVFSYNYTGLEHDFRRGENINDNNPFINEGLQFVFFEDFSYDNTAHELRWVSPEINRFSWVVGAFSEDNVTHINIREMAVDQWILQRNPSNPEILDVLALTGAPANHVFYSDENFGVKQQAFYGELTFDFTDKWQATAGIRYAEWEQGPLGSTFIAGDSFFDGNDLEGTTVADFPDIPVDEYTFEDPKAPFEKNDTTTGKINVAYRPKDDTLIFAQWSEGYRLVELGVNTIEEPRCQSGGSDAVPGLEGQNLGDQVSDSLTNWEIGLKKSWRDGRVTTNFGYYFIDWENIQFEGELPEDCGGILPNGDAEISGFEYEISALLTENMILSLSGAFTDAKVTRVPEVQREDGTFIPIETLDVLGAYNGTKLAGVPETQVAVTLDYTWPGLISNFNGNLNANYVYTSAVTNNLNEKGLEGLRGSQLKADTVKLFNLIFTMERQNLSFRIYANNILDKVSSTFTTTNTDESRLFYNVTRPRTFGVGVRYQF